LQTFTKLYCSFGDTSVFDMNTPAWGVNVDAALVDAVDLHVHPSPSPFPRRIGILEAATEAASAGFRTIAVKSHHHSMVTDVLAVEQAVGELPLTVLSGVALNSQVGGLNPSAVELTLTLGGRILWFPTISAVNHLALAATLATFPTSTHKLSEPRPVPVLDGDGRLLNTAVEILVLIRDADAVLACGHLSADEIDVLIAGARDIGVRRILVNHPNFVVGATVDRCAEWARQGVYIEHSLSHYDAHSMFRKWDLDVLLEYIRASGVSHTVISSDLGQVNNPTPTEAYRAIVPRLASAGLDLNDIRQLVGGSATALID
jgi:hypothetical protein